MAGVGEVWADAGLHVDGSSFAQYGAMLKQAEGQVSSFSDGTKAAMASAFMIPAAAVTGAAAYGAAIGASYETAGIKLETLYGTQQKANEEFQWLSDFAASTPFEFPELLQVDGLLKNAGLSAQEYIKGVGDASAAQGKTIEQTTEAIVDAMTGEYERLKEYGITSVEITSKNYEKLGVAAEDAGKRALLAIDKNGKEQVMVVDQNNKQMIASTILAFWNDKYAGAMEKQSQTITGMYSTIKDNIKNGLAELAGFDMSSMTIETFSILGALKELAGVAIVVSDKFANMSEPMQTFVLVATIGGAAALALAGGLIAAQVAGITATGVMAALGFAVNTVIWPATLIVGALALVAAGLVYLDEKTGIVTYSWTLFKDLFTITTNGIITAAGILWDFITLAMDGIKTAISDMFPPGFLEGVGNAVNGIISQFSNMGVNIHTKAEGIRADNGNIGTSAQTAGGQVTGATGQMMAGFTGAGASALGMGANTLTATGQMVSGFGAAGGAATTMGGNVAGTVPAVNSLTGAAGSGTAANQSYAASFIYVSTQASAAASAAISAASRIGSAIKTSMAQVGELEALAGKWNTRAKLGITSSGGAGTGEGNVKVVANPNNYTASETATRSANLTVYNNNKQTINNNGDKLSASKAKAAGV